jgi:uracil-DNA glycosylase
MTSNVHNSWSELFEQYEFNLDALYKDETEIYPPKDQVFRVFEIDVKDIKVLLLGQDCYHNPGQANGLAFSVNSGVVIPPSLRNIYKELVAEFPEREYDFKHGNLERWFYEEKIFLLNSALTVEKNKPGSHISIWQEFTDDVIEFVSEKNKNCLFVLLGNFAKSKKKFIKDKTRVIEAAHPSPLSANRGFFDSNLFRNIEGGIGHEINWRV